MLNEIKQTKDKILAFKYDFDPLTTLKISDELKNNPHFIGFGVDKKPIIADISAVKVFVDDSYGYEIPIYNEYAWVGMDDFEQPIYQDTDEYLIEIRDAWCELYKFKFKNNKALALDEYEQLYHQELALIGEGKAKLLKNVIHQSSLVIHQISVLSANLLILVITFMIIMQKVIHCGMV